MDERKFYNYLRNSQLMIESKETRRQYINKLAMMYFGKRAGGISMSQQVESLLYFNRSEFKKDARIWLRKSSKSKNLYDKDILLDTLFTCNGESRLVVRRRFPLSKPEEFIHIFSCVDVNKWLERTGSGELTSASLPVLGELIKIGAERTILFGSLEDLTEEEEEERVTKRHVSSEDLATYPSDSSDSDVVDEVVIYPHVNDLPPLQDSRGYTKNPFLCDGKNPFLGDGKNPFVNDKNPFLKDCKKTFLQEINDTRESRKRTEDCPGHPTPPEDTNGVGLRHSQRSTRLEDRGYRTLAKRLEDCHITEVGEEAEGLIMPSPPTRSPTFVVGDNENRNCRTPGSISPTLSDDWQVEDLSSILEVTSDLHAFDSYDSC